MKLAGVYIIIIATAMWLKGSNIITVSEQRPASNRLDFLNPNSIVGVGGQIDHATHVCTIITLL